MSFAWTYTCALARLYIGNGEIPNANYVVVSKLQIVFTERSRPKNNDKTSRKRRKNKKTKRRALILENTVAYLLSVES